MYACITRETFVFTVFRRVFHSILKLELCRHACRRRDQIIPTCRYGKNMPTTALVIALFISIFLRNRSLSDARWFCGKKCKIGKGNLYLTENRLSWNEMCCASDNHNYMCHTWAKEFLNSSFNSAVIDKISNFQDIAPNFTFSQIS